MKIAIVCGPYVPVPPPKYGGIEQVVYYLIKGLKEAGHEPILLGPGDSTIDCEIIPVIDKALSFPKTKKNLKEHQRLVKKYNRDMKRHLKALLPTIDIIHSHGFDMTPFADFPNVTTIHNKITFDGVETERVDYFLERKSLPYVSISQNQQAACPELNFVGTVYNGEDPSQFPLVTKPDDYVCFLGRFDRDKNPHLAIQLAINLGLKIKLAGKVDHEGEGYFEEEVAKYFDNPLVEYLGELNFEDKVDLLSHAKVNLHPTNFREPFGLTVLEAAYCGTPTMAIARGSMPELIEADRTGVLVEDFVEGRFSIEKCYQMDREYIAMRARKLFNYRNMTDQYVATYQQVIAAQPVVATTHANPIRRFLGQFLQTKRFA
jgi:glycosyltransferase involved in cell wall biosynthesis